MKCQKFSEIISRYTNKRKLSKYTSNKLPIEIQNSMQYLIGNELSCDCRFENDDGNYLYANRDDGDNFVLLATSGQGDEWLLNLSDQNICFLDHDIWEKSEAISSLKITFEQFVIMADLLGQFEEMPTSEEMIKRLKRQLCSIKDTLVESYPFNFT